MSDLRKKVFAGGLPPPGAHHQRLAAGKSGGFMRKKDYSPVPWSGYFATKEDVTVTDGETFRVYSVGEEGPVCLLLHGGGFSALSWALLAKYLTGVCRCRCVAMDIRGHGDTVTTDEVNLSAAVLAEDVSHVVRSLFGDQPPPIVLIGHSMGGAIAVHCASRNLIPSLVGLTVIDVVEGSAMDALSSMQSFLRGRPKTFKSIDYAVEYCVRSGQVRNIESARVSMVGQVKRLDGTTAAAELESRLPAATETITEEPDPPVTSQPDQPVTSQSEGAPTSSRSPSTSGAATTPDQKPPDQVYTWRVDLARTERHWRGWFQGLSALFLAVAVPKLLLLAGIDRLDRDLTVGQMQGKFQMQILAKCGHAVHEDAPEKVGDVIATFLVRHKFAESSDQFQR